MRTLRLVGAVVEAEKLRLRARAARMGRRMVVALVAAAFGLCALAGLHVIGYLALRTGFAALPAAAIVFGVDVVLAAGLGLIAARSGESLAEREARMVQRQALQTLEDSAAVLGLLAALARLVGGRSLCEVTLAGLLGRWFGRR